MNAGCLKNLTADNLLNIVQQRQECKLHLQKPNWQPRDTSPFLHPSSATAQLDPRRTGDHPAEIHYKHQD